jgi:hypothetical protein
MLDAGTQARSAPTATIALTPRCSTAGTRPYRSWRRTTKRRSTSGPRSEQPSTLCTGRPRLEDVAPCTLAHTEPPSLRASGSGFVVAPAMVTMVESLPRDLGQSLRTLCYHWSGTSWGPMKLSLALPTAAAALIAAAAPAHTDQYDLLFDLDNQGVYYDSISDMIDIGKLTCGSLRRGTPIVGPAGVGATLTRIGYTGVEAAIITMSAARNMCPDQLPRVLGSATSIDEPPVVVPNPCDSDSPPAGLHRRVVLAVVTANVGDFVQDRRGPWITLAPTHCAHGHRL